MLAEDTLMLVEISREVESSLATGEAQRAAAAFRDNFIPEADDLAQKILILINEPNQQIRFSAL